MDKHAKKPCSTCRKLLCTEKECARWQEWFSSQWDKTCDQIREQLWKEKDRLGRQALSKRFRYALPHEHQDPCKDCTCRAWCDTPCSLRFNWWDYRIGTLYRNSTSREHSKGVKHDTYTH